MTYAMPDYSGGMIGMRTFYSAVELDDLTIIHSSVALDRSALQELYTRFSGLKAEDWMQEEYEALRLAVEASQEKQFNDQRSVDAEVDKLNNLFGKLVHKHSMEELRSLVEQCEKYKREDFTTENAYRSMLSLIERTQNVEESDVEKISELYYYMEYLIDNALGGVV